MYRLGQEEINAVAEVIQSKMLFKVNNGLRCAENFEKEGCARFGTKHMILMTSGNAALISAMTALGIGPGDEVIVPAYTYIATAMAVVATGAIPVIAEVDETLTIDAADAEKKITPRTKAIIPVHIMGFICDMDAICALAQKYGLYVIEDACQAIGGTYHGKNVGTIGIAGAHSYQQAKIITCGEGGALLTSDDDLYQKAMIYHDSNGIAFFGNQMDSFTMEPFCGNEFRIDEVKAAIMREQLKKLDPILQDLRRNKKEFMDELKDEYTFIPSHDPEGDCGVAIPFFFDTEEDARYFADAVKPTIMGAHLPIDTDRHIYCNWTPIMEKRGAMHPAMDPFKMDANKDHIPDYRKDMCPKTLALLSRTVYFKVNPDWTEDRKAVLLDAIRKANPTNR